MSRLGAALHILRGKPTIFRVGLYPTHISADGPLYVQDCTFSRGPTINGIPYTVNTKGELVPRRGGK